MVTKEQAWKKAHELLADEVDKNKLITEEQQTHPTLRTSAYHFGRIELNILLNYIYEEEEDNGSKHDV